MYCHHHPPSGLTNNRQQGCREQNLHPGVLTLSGHCNKGFPQPEASGVWCNEGLSLPPHPSDTVPTDRYLGTAGWPFSRGRISSVWLLISFSLPSDSASHPIYLPDCNDYKVHQGFFHALGQNFKKAPICSSSGVQERQWWVQDILQHCAKYVRVYWKHSGQLWRNTWQVGWPELVALTGNRNSWGTYRVKRSLWTPIAEQHVLYVHCSRNRRELWHKYTAENVKVHPRATSRLKTIQPLHPLRAKPDALHSGS